MKDFRSDNTQGCSPEILEAIARAAHGTMTSYGDDEITGRVRAQCRDIFETEVEVFPVITGTAGNALALASMRPETIVCHEDAHIVRDELGAPEFYTGGVKIVAVPGEGGKIQPSVLQRPSTAALSLTNATEAGTVYTADELRALTAAGDFSVHLDGARFANAVAATGSSPADLTWRAGVDVMVFGGTKNGLLGAELIVVFRKELAQEIAPRWHRAGHRPAKMRFLSAQFEAYLTGDLWLRNARHANAMAKQLANGLDLIHPVEANEVFARFTPEVAQRLMGEGYQFYDWPIFGADAYRMVTGFATTVADVSDFAKSIAL
jgi:threonine aldolase